jgi:hypothetical protein
MDTVVSFNSEWFIAPIGQNDAISNCKSSVTLIGLFNITKRPTPRLSPIGIIIERVRVVDNKKDHSVVCK